MFHRRCGYRPRFRGYYILRGLIQILDGILSLIVCPFGLECDLYLHFCEWNLRKDCARLRRCETQRSYWPASFR